MTLQIDHIVHFINCHPKEIVDILKEKGFEAVMGGKHEHWGTYNSLLYSKKSYIEFLSVENEEVANKSDNPLILQLTNDLEYGEGLGQVCFRTHNILQLKQRLIAQGYSTSKIFNGSRKREDAKMIRWKMLFITEECELPYPFFIEWEQTDMERLKDLSDQGLIDNQLKDSRISSIHFQVMNVNNVVDEWSKFFRALEDFVEVDNSATNTKSIHIDDCKLIFTQPDTDESDLLYQPSKKDQRLYQISFDPALGKRAFDLFGGCYR